MIERTCEGSHADEQEAECAEEEEILHVFRAAILVCPANILQVLIAKEPLQKSKNMNKRVEHMYTPYSKFLAS
jgi:hypothetical protein